ncbi:MULTISPECIES: hypothetical protein [Rhodonellum]|nr:MULTISPECIES: hypothetical protein [Rhodonellum]
MPNVLEIRDLQHQVQKTGMTAEDSFSIHHGLVRVMANPLGSVWDTG